MTLWLAAGWVALALVAALGAIVVYFVARGKIYITRLLNEPTGDASMSRFQLLIFTFVIALGLLLVMVSGDTPSFPEAIPGSVLALLGISASSYVVSKSIQFSDEEGIKDKSKPDKG